MIIFLNDDRAYLSWVRSHRGGFVLEARRQGRGRRLVHRSTCETVRSGKHRHWTTGQQLKACSMSLPEIVDWVRETCGCELSCCPECQPTTEAPEDVAANEADAMRLTPLASNILNYSLETAIVHLTNHPGRYRLTIREVADCLHKTPAQLTGAIQRLVAAGLLTVSPPGRNGRFAARATILPTIAALRTLDGYAGWAETELHEELQRLSSSDAMTCEGANRCHAACG